MKNTKPKPVKLRVYRKYQFLLVAALLACPATANDASPTSSYAGQEKRSVKSLSPDDIAELKAGSGWGLAKVAELNGVPGPRHLLDMKKEIGLSSSQIEAIEALFKEMNAAAIVLGQKLIEKEEQLERRFQTNVPKPQELKLLLQDIGEVRSELRFVHLSAHLATPDILSAAQIKHYNQLRGYASNDLCANAPKGHNKAMWKKHHNCE